MGICADNSKLHSENNNTMQYAVVTGANQGIGKAIAAMLLEKGCNVAVCARNYDKLLSVTNEWKQQYPNADILACKADLSIQTDVAAFADKVLNRFPQIDMLVNNTGTYQPGLLANEPDGLLQTMIGTNLYSAYWLTRALLPVMKSKAKGHIFNMCSVASLKAYTNGGAYSISKYALLGFTDNLREELREDNIKVTAICPGAVWSPSWEGSGVSPERIMEANDVAAMIWATFNLSAQAVAETIVMRPAKGDL